MKPQGIIFDLDGTLLNTLGDITDAMNKALVLRNFPSHSKEEYKLMVGDGASTLVRRASPEQTRNDNDLIEGMTRDYKQNYRLSGNRKTYPYDGIQQILAKLDKEGIACAILSNKTQEDVDQCVEDFFCGYPFAMVSGQRDEIPIKPNPEAAIRIAHTMNLPVEHIFFIGDSKVDMQTAVAAGMIPVGVLWGFREKDELLGNGAQVLLHTPADLFRYL